MSNDSLNELAESVDELRQRLCALITKETAPTLHPPHLLPLAKDGKGHFLVEMALCGDLLGILNDAAAFSGSLPSDDEQRLRPFAMQLLRQYSRYRRDYLRLLETEAPSLADSLAFHRSDAKPFGHGCEATRWAGLGICRRVDAAQSRPEFEDEFRSLLERFIEAVTASQPLAAAKPKLLATLRDAEPGQAPIAGRSKSTSPDPEQGADLPAFQTARIACEADLFKELMEIAAVSELAERFAAVRKLSDARCGLLRDGVRVTPRILPKVMTTVDKIRRVIGDDIACEAYVFSDPTINAFVTVQDDVALIGLSSGSVEQLSAPGELEFVLGHELGHVLFDHPRIAARPLLESRRLTIRQAMRLRAWERAAEISADRVGLLVSGSLRPALTAFFKLRSGISLGNHTFDLQAYCDQWDELAAEITALGARDLWDCSHPVAPLRVKAMSMYWDAAQSSGPKREQSIFEVDNAVQRMLAMMDPSEICDNTTGSDALLAPFYFWGGLYVAMADGDLTDAERAKVRELAPPGFDAAESFVIAKTDPARCLSQFKGDLASRRRKLSAIELYRIMSGVLDVARSDGHLSDAERARVHELGEAIGLHDVACELVIKRHLSEQEATA
jgi:hypothetical protein